jgi:hypothetical protein
MKSEVKIQGPNWKIIIPITLATVSLIAFLSWWFENEMRTILIAIGVTLALLGLIGVLSYAGITYFLLAEKYQHLRIVTYQADKAQLERYVLSFPKTQRLVTLPDSNVRVIEALAEPTTYKALPDTTQDPLDLLTVFTQATQSYACIGGQQTGKTYQMRHIASYWLNRGITPVIVGPKWDKGEWAGCILFGGNGDFSQVAKGIAIVRQEAQKRHAADISHKDHRILPVFFDDWTPIVDAVDNARELVLQATTLYASVNIILYFILHSDTANAWGVDRKGAALKDNFIKLFITPHYDANGLIVRTKTRGFIRFPGDDSEEYPVKLLDGPVTRINEPMESDDYINLEVEPTPGEAFVIRLYEQGESKRNICEQVFGYVSSNKYPEIDRILAKFNIK